MNLKYSFIIPTFNSDRYLIDCLDSLQNQSYKNIEVIIVDKSSKDRTLEIINSYNNLNIKIFNQIDHAVALGFKKSSGDFIQFLGSDDFLFDKDTLNKLNKKITIEDMLVCCNYCKINEKGKIIEKIITNFNYKKLLNFGNEICATSFLLNRKLFDIHGFDGLEGFDLHLML